MLLSIRQINKQHNKRENNRRQQSRDLQRERGTQNARNRWQNMSTKERQQKLFRRRSNYREAKDKGKQVRTTSATNRNHICVSAIEKADRRTRPIWTLMLIRR